MTKAEFMQRLHASLQALPPEEINNAMSYYEEYFDDAGPDHEKDVINELQSPEKIAVQLVAASPSTGKNSVHKARGNELPGCFTQLIRKGVLAFFLCISAVILLLLFLTGVGVIGTGIISLAVGMAILISLSDGMTALMVTGAGFFAVGLGVILDLFCGMGLKSVWKRLHRRVEDSSKEETADEKK